jgi:GxxExxY protein
MNKFRRKDARSAKENAKKRREHGKGRCVMFEERDGLDLRDEPSDEANQLSKLVVGAEIEVHRQLGPGHLESAYEEAMCIELSLRGIPFQRQYPVPLLYKGHPVGDSRLDLLIGGLLVVELKACEAILPVHRAKAIAYLRASGKQLALILNFNVQLMKEGIKCIVLTS